MGVALVASASSCGSSGQATRRDPGAIVTTPVGVRAVAAALRPAGTEMTPGVAVPEGAMLVGEVFPLVTVGSSAADGPPAWQAVLLVDGDPSSVWQGLADDLGVGQEASAVASCVVSRPLTEAERADRVGAQPAVDRSRRLLPEPVLDGEDRIDCSASVGAVRMALAVGASRCTDPTICVEAPTAHLVVSVGGPSLESDRPSLGTDELRYERVASSLPPGSQDQPGPDDWPPLPGGPIVVARLPKNLPGSHLPGPGQLLDDGLDPYLTEPDGPESTGSVAPVDEVPAGSRSLVAPALVIECNSGLVAVLDQPGAPDDALETYDQADLVSDDPMISSSGVTADDRRWSAGTISTAGGYQLSVTAVADGSGEGSTVLVTECGD